MLGEQGGNSRWGKYSGDEEKKEDKEKIEGAKNIFFCLPQKQKKKKSNWPRLKQIDLGWNKLT